METEDKTVGGLVRDAVSDAVGVDGALWTTVGRLVRQPGALADAYARGGADGTLRPTRVYLLASVALFAVLRLADPGAAIGRALQNSERAWLASGAPSADRELVEDLGRLSREARARAAYDAGRASRMDSLRARLAAGVVGADDRQAGADAIVTSQTPPDVRERWGTEEEIAATQGAIVGSLLEWLPLALIAGVPVYAVGLFLVAGGRRSGVVALALAAHVHAVAYVGLAAGVAVAWAAGWGLVVTASAVAVALGLAGVCQSRALRRVHDVSAVRAAVSTVALGAVYLVGVAVVVGAGYGVAMLASVGPA